MFRSIFVCLLLFIVPSIEGAAQSHTQPVGNTVYHPPSADETSWQRLNLLLSATYFRVVKEGEVDFDSCLLYASRSLGLSRASILAEGIDDQGSFAQSQWIDRRDPAAGMRLLSQVKGKKHLQQLLLLGSYYAFEPKRYYRRDSVEYFLFKAINESNTLKELKLRRQGLWLLGKMYFEVNDVQHGDSVFNQLIKECREAGDKETQARALVYKGLFPPYSPATTPNRIADFQIAADIYHELNNAEGEINALMDVGYMLVTMFELGKANDVFLKALQISEAIKYPYTHYITDALAMVTGFEGKFGEPLKYTLQTIKTAETIRDSIGWAYFYSRLGMLYKMEGQREDESLKWSLKALDRFVKVGDAGLFLNLYNVAGIMKEQGRGKEALALVQGIAKKIPPRHPQDQIFYNLSFANCYESTKQYELAAQYAMEADRIQKRFPTLRGAHQKSSINLLFGEIYFEAGQFERSKDYLEAYLSDPFRQAIFGNDVTAYSRLITIDSIFGDAASGLHRYWKYTRILDSNYRVSKIRQAEELQVMYQTQEKENQIALLNQQAKLEQANIKQATLEKNMSISAGIAVLVVAALLYRQNRQRQKSNRLVTRKNDQLQHLLSEKEWLLKEIHHRVKNNLQIVMSLLNSQSVYIDNEPALTAIHDSQHRVHAMSLIHQKLYSSENVSTIDMSIYIRELGTYLSDSFDTGQRIRFAYDIEPLEMDVSQAVPLGLILNEAITNAIKYAFPDGRSGIISLSLTTTAPQHYVLRISDNGIGISTGLNSKKGSLGMSLMEGLSEDLNGKLAIENDQGTTIEITFVQDGVVKRSNTLAEPLVSSN
jgi:two-component system, sensor histidine kinase PdtaS